MIHLSYIFLLASSIFNFLAFAEGRSSSENLFMPYCFLVPIDSSPETIECAEKSVAAIKAEYAKAGVHVKAELHWWGAEYSRDPSALRQEATEACNLEEAFGKVIKGTNPGSIQVFVDEPIPAKQCGEEDPKNPGKGPAGCSSFCDGSSPSFSTVSNKRCSPSVSVHESGHSNCCARKCENKDKCPTPESGDDGGCELCLRKGGESARFSVRSLFSANEDQALKGESCTLTGHAHASIAAGASQNPGYNDTLPPKLGPRPKDVSIRSTNGQVIKLLGKWNAPDPKGKSPQPAPKSNNEGTPRLKTEEGTRGVPPQDTYKSIGDD